MKAPCISVVIAFKNSSRTIGACLDGLRAQTCEDFEVVLVDDASTDDSALIARGRGFAPIAASRPWPEAINEGVRAARGDIMFCTDADVVLPPDTLSQAERIFSENPALDAVVGVYSARHPHRNISSLYKNLWIRFSYMQCSPGVSFVFGAATAFRRDTFLRAGGYAPDFRVHLAGADIELGMRLAAAGCVIRIDRAVEVIHLKRYSFSGLMKNELYRSMGYAGFACRRHLIMRSLRTGFTNVYPGFIWSVVLAWCAVILSAAALPAPAFAAPAALCACAYFALNKDFYRYCMEQDAPAAGEPGQGAAVLFCRTAAMVLVGICDHLICGAGCLIGIGRTLLKQCTARSNNK